MARMSIDDSVTRDPDFDHLAELLGWDRREAVGCMFEVWAVCYDRVTPNLTPREIETTARRGARVPVTRDGGFVGALLECGLGRKARETDTHFERADGTLIPWRDPEWKQRIHLRGAAKRIGYLLTSKESGARGGVRSGESRRDSAKGRLNQPSSDPSTDPQGSLNPSSSVPDSASASASASVPDPAEATPREEEKKRSAKPRVPSGPHQEAIAAFDSYFARTHSGAKPTWKGKNASLMAGLVGSHGLHEIVRRIAVLERTPPSFPPAPWDMPTFSSHFDKIATPAQRQQPDMNRRDLRAGDLLELQLQRVAEAEEAERERNGHDRG